MDSRGINGADGGLSISIGGEQDAARVGIQVARALEHLDAAHSGHALVAN